MDRGRFRPGGDLYYVQSNTETICRSGAAALAKAVREKELSPVEIVEAFLARIDEINPKLNAYVTLIPDSARAAAKAAEKAVMDGDTLGPIHGVPISIKDLTMTAGVRTTMGSRVYEDHVPEANSPVVDNLLAAGGIILGKTNTPEFGWVSITDNEVFGRTNNPWNVEYTTAGSSGGAGAAAAAGLSPIALGSDGGGSVRHPASFCGLFGIKPTFGLIPRGLNDEGWPTMSHIGPLARTVEDGALGLDAMSGFDARDMNSAPLPAQNFYENLQRDLKGLRVAWSADLGFAQVDPEVRAAFEKALSGFEALGCELREGHPDMNDAPEIFESVVFPELVGADIRYIEADGSSKMNPLLAGFVASRKDMLARDYFEGTRARRRLVGRVQEFFTDVDLLLTPTMAIPPFKHPGSDLSGYPTTVNGVKVGSRGWHPFTPPFNLTHQPAASVPIGFSEAGLPIGLQIVGRRFEDLLVTQAAAAFETARPWAEKWPELVS